MTTPQTESGCPAEAMLKLISGKWKPQMLRMAMDGPLRFSALLRELSGSNRQSLSVALNDLEHAGLLHRHVLQEKPLHVEYTLTERGRATLPLLQQLADLAGND
ncbi:MAG: helix-turn-helix transcriptional regulator [Bacteroidetes bacterium]|nr:helix-turn-helix transcriptional regulator [Bacteroidota bacterium]